MTPQPSTVALDDVTAERTAGGGGQFEIDFGAGRQRAEGGLVEGFLREIGVKERRMHVQRGQADAGDARESPSRRPPARPGASTVMRRTPPRLSRLMSVPVCSIIAGEHGFSVRSGNKE